MKTIKAIGYVENALKQSEEAIKLASDNDIKARLEIIQLSCSIAIDRLTELQTQINNLI